MDKLRIDFSKRFYDIAEVKDFLEEQKINIECARSIAKIVASTLFLGIRVAIVTIMITLLIYKKSITNFTLYSSLMIVMTLLSIIIEVMTYKAIERIVIQSKLDFIAYCGQRFELMNGKLTETQIELFLDDCSRSIGLKRKKGRKIYD